MFTRLRTSPHGVVGLWLLLAGGCVNLTPPWENAKDAASRTGGTLVGGNAGTVAGSAGGGLTATGGSLAGGANGDDAASAGGAAGGSQTDSNQVTGSGGAGGAVNAGGTVATGGTVGPGGTVAPDSGYAMGGTVGTGGTAAKGGNAAGGTTATGGTTALPDAQSADQSPKKDIINGPEVPDAGLDAPVDAPTDPPPGSDLPTDPAPAVSTVGLVAYYPCEQASGTKLPDLSGNGKDADLVGATSFTTGQVGNGLALTAINGVDGGASGGYASLPPGIIAGATELTVSAWFKINSIVTYDNFERVFDFGTSNSTSSMYFTPRNASGLPQFTIRFRPEAGTEIKQDLIWTAGTATTASVWHHVAVVLDAAGGHLYLDGVSVASSATMTMKPADLGAMPNNWIGRSEFPNDPYFDGMIDEFRVYSRALTAAEIAILFAAR